MGRKAGTYNYYEAFRAEAVALVIDEKMPVSKASKQVGVSYETLRKWLKESGCTREDEESKTDKQRIKELERENKALKMERDILKGAVDHRAKWPVQKMCAALRMSRQSYYAWKRRSEAPRDVRRVRLLREVKSVFKESNWTYGSPRMTKQSRKDGHTVTQ